MVVNVDVTVIAERPKLLPHLDAMRANLAGALGVESDAVSIKGKTNEGVDADRPRRGDGVSCGRAAGETMNNADQFSVASVQFQESLLSLNGQLVTGNLQS